MVDPLGKTMEGGAVLTPGFRKEQTCRADGEELDESVLEEL
jgi:hypothetical protein